MSVDDAQVRALRIVRDALDTEPSLRDDFIRDQCREDPTLHQLVRQLLLEAARFDEEIVDGVVDDFNLPNDPLPGTLLGSFRVVERIGRGGTGVVYRAEREGADFQQTVAIKLIRSGFDFDDVRARFLRERRILARLHHPNLVGFIDGGVTADGRPWFALEHVRGETIRAWSDSRRLDVRRRVQLFLAVCAAVQYAHTQLIVHRDLKPGNILIEESGTVKLLDFGISHLLEGDEADGQTLTVLGQRIAMTPEYAAPEQFRGDPAGVAGDVYSLGVILYELLSGVLPYPIDRRDLAAAERLIREVPAQPLAQAIIHADASAVFDGVTGAARTNELRRESAVQRRLMARNMSLRAYQAVVRGDLNRVLTKALEKDPAQRYSTVAEFAGDLGRWLDGVPVRVSGRRLGYRARKFIGRNRLALGLAAVIVLVAVAGLAGTLMQLRQSRIEADRANAVQDYLVSLLESAAPGGSGDKAEPIRALLQDGISSAQVQFADRPLLHASMLIVLGRVHAELGFSDQATLLLQQALDLLEREGDDSSALFVDAVVGMAGVHSDRRLWPEAQALAHRGLKVVAQGDLPRQARLRRILGYNLMLRGEGEAGRRELTTALALTRDVEVPPAQDVSLVLVSLATGLQSAGLREEAVPYLEEALAINRRIHGEIHFSVAGVLVSLGDISTYLAFPEEGRAYYGQAIAIYEKVRPAAHTAHAMALVSLAETDLGTGRYADAENLLRRALEMHESLYGPDDPRVAESLMRLGAVLDYQERWQEMLSVSQRAAEMFTRAPGEWRQELARSKQQVAKALYFVSRLEESETNTREAWKIMRDRFGDHHPETLFAQALMARATHGSGRAGEAHDLMVDVLDKRARVRRLEYRYFIDLLIEMGDVSLDDGDVEQALIHYRRALGDSLLISDGTDDRTVFLRLRMAQAFAAAGNPAECREQELQLLNVASRTMLREHKRRALAALSCDDPNSPGIDSRGGFRESE